MSLKRGLIAAGASIAGLLLPVAALAVEHAEEVGAVVEEASHATEAGHGARAITLIFFLFVMLMFARIGALMERIGQPAVLGELLMGVVLGALAFLPGFGFIDSLKGEEFIALIAEIGVIILLFRTGLESNLREMKSVGVKAFLVATVGVILPFVGGYFAAKLLIPGLEGNAYLFIGATLTATSVGITARVFKDLNVLSSKEAKIVLGAAVIDDIMGLLILAVVAGIVSGGGVSLGGIAWISAKALLFLVISVALGQLFAKRIGFLFSKIHSGVGMKMALALLFCGVYAYGAQVLAGLAPIVGAFAAGLVLDPLHFNDFVAPTITKKMRGWADRLKGSDSTANAVGTELMHEAEHEEHMHVENLVEQIGWFFMPIFFVYTGLQVNLETFANPKVLIIGLAITVVAFVGKIAAGWASGKGVSHSIIGFGMIPRGEVGLIFANVGKQLGVVTDEVFSMIVIMVILSTLLTPPLLGVLIKRRMAGAGGSTPEPHPAETV
ncbi:MAG: cation:proton antiporter [Patescibacteria group bacterium]